MTPEFSPQVELWIMDFMSLFEEECPLMKEQIQRALRDNLNEPLDDDIICQSVRDAWKADYLECDDLFSYLFHRLVQNQLRPQL
jgi:hypothetical protein